MRQSVVILLALAACASPPPAAPPRPAASTCTDAPDVPVAAVPTTPAAAPAPPAPAKPRARTVLVSIDSLRPADLANASVRIPHLRKLMARGARARSVASVWPSVTYPAHATIVSGATPREHGIGSNKPIDPTYQNDSGWYWYAEELKRKTLWQAAKAHGLTTGNVYWPVTVGATFDWSFPQIWRKKIDEDDKLMRSLTIPRELPGEMRARFPALPAEHRFDKERADAAVFLLEEKKPDFLLVYFTDLDTERHGSGPDSAQSNLVLELSDHQLGRVLAALHDDDLAASRVFVVSDHGFAKVSRVTRPAVFFRERGLIVTEGKNKVKAHSVAVSADGGMCAIHLTDPRDRARVAEAVAALAKDPKYGIDRVYEEAALAEKGGFPGATWALAAKAGTMFDGGLEGKAAELATYKGHHGYPPDQAEMRAVFVAAGVGIARGKEAPDASLVDVAPTVARAMDVPWEAGGGRVIEEMLDR